MSLHPSFCHGDDDRTFSLLLMTSSNDRETLTKKLFDDLLSRFLSDIGSSVSGAAGDEYWNQLLEKAKVDGFSIEYSCVRNDSFTSSSSCAASLVTSEFPVEYQTEKVKAHLAATCSLLGVSPQAALLITEDALRKNIKRLKNSRRKSNFFLNESKNDEIDFSKSLLSSLFGTRILLLIVRDYHYAQQISRIRFIAEALRREHQKDEERIKSLCSDFLSQFDERITLTYSHGGANRRGLFQILLSMACAPEKSLGRGVLYLSSSLSTYNTENDGESLPPINIPIYYALSDQDFSRHLMEEHSRQHNIELRTEALEALFALFYGGRIESINRGDYMLLLSSFESQNFFTNYKRGFYKEKKICSIRARKQSQLCALILAGSLNLCKLSNINSELVLPLFLSGDEQSVRQEINYIGRDLLLHKFSCRVLKRRHTALSNKRRNDNDFFHYMFEEEKVEAPESIALLTFGVLLKLCHKNVPHSALNLFF